MSAPRKVGILGGMGPEATMLLQQRLIARMSGGDDADHILLIIDMNPQVPSRIAHLIEKTGEDPGPVLAEMGRRLEQAGAEVLAMPCNTAHHYAEQIREATELPLLNMVDLSAETAFNRVGEGGCVGILASPAVQATGLFDKVFSRMGISTRWPEDSDLMLSAIRLIKANGPCKEAKEILLQASRELRSQGAQLQLVACSEYLMIADSTGLEANVIDTLDVLVAAIIGFSV